MSQPAYLWIRSSKLWWSPRHKHSKRNMNTFYQNMVLFCCVLHNTQHKHLYSLSTSAQLATSSVEGAVWLHVVRTLFADWSLYLENLAIRLLIRVKTNLWIHTFFPPQHNNVPLTYCGQLDYLSRSLFSCSAFLKIVFHILAMAPYCWFLLLKFLYNDSSRLSLSYIFNSTKLFSSALRDPSLCMSIQTAAAKCCSVSH